MLVFFPNLSLVEFQVRYFVLFLLFLVIDSFEWFWMGSLHKNIQLMLEFLKAPFLLIPHFSYCTLMTFLMMLSVILLYMLSILLSVIRRLNCGNNLIWQLNLNLMYKTLWTGARSGLLISMLGTLSWFCLTGLRTLVLLLWKSMGMFLRENLLRCCGWSSLLYWTKAPTSSLLLKTASMKIGALIHFVKFLSREVALYLYKSTIRTCMEYCCHIWDGAPSCYLELLDNLQKRMCRTVGPSCAASLKCGKLKSFLYNYYFGTCIQNWLNWSHFFFL